MRALRTWDRESQQLAAWLLGTPATGGATPQNPGKIIDRDQVGLGLRLRLGDILQPEGRVQFERLGIRAFGRVKKL